MRATRPVRFVVSAIGLGWALLRAGRPVRRSLAERLGDLPLADAPVSRPVRVRWSDRQIPFIEAADDDDLAAALGIVHLHLRWTQMEAMRHLVHGRAVRHGFMLLLVGVVITLPVVDGGWPLWATFLTWSVGGLGMGLLFNPATVAAMSYAAPGEEGLVGGQVNLADSIGWSLIGGVGGATVAIADRTSWSLEGAFITNFGIAAAAAVLGILVSRRVRVAGAASA